GVRCVEEIVLADVVNMHPVGLYAIVEKAPIGAPHGLSIGFRTVLGIEEIIPGLRFGDDQNADIALDRTRFKKRLLLWCIGPFGKAACHVRARRAAAVHAVGAKGTKEGTIKQRPIAQIENARRAGGKGGHGQEPNIFGLHDAAVLLIAAEHLRLQPKRTARTLGMPPLLAASGSAGQVGPEEVLPGLEATAAWHPGETVELDL